MRGSSKISPMPFKTDPEKIRHEQKCTPLFCKEILNGLDSDTLNLMLKNAEK